MREKKGGIIISKCLHSELIFHDLSALFICFVFIFFVENSFVFCKEV